MALLDLPIELFEPVVSILVEAVGVEDALKYREVCSKISCLAAS
jgi:hypothetical protein